MDFEKHQKIGWTFWTCPYVLICTKRVMSKLVIYLSMFLWAYYWVESYTLMHREREQDYIRLDYTLTEAVYVGFLETSGKIQIVAW